MSTKTAPKKAAAKTSTKVAESKPMKAKPAKAVVVEQASEAIKIENTTNSPRMTAIHYMWDLLQASPMTAQQLAEKVAESLVKKNRMKAEDASKLATSAINHQLPYETGQKGRKSIRVKEIKGGKLEWVGGSVRRRGSAA